MGIGSRQTKCVFERFTEVSRDDFNNPVMEWVTFVSVFGKKILWRPRVAQYLAWRTRLETNRQ